MKSRHLSLRISEQDYENLEALAQSRGESVSDCARRLIEEGRRMADHPGIEFRDGLMFRNGLRERIPALSDGPALWTIISVFPDWDDSWDIRSPELVGATSVNAYQAMVAQRYYKQYPEDIDRFIRENNEMAEKAYAEWLESQRALAR